MFKTTRHKHFVLFLHILFTTCNIWYVKVHFTYLILKQVISLTTNNKYCNNWAWSLQHILSRNFFSCIGIDKQIKQITNETWALCPRLLRALFPYNWNVACIHFVLPKKLRSGFFVHKTFLWVSDVLVAGGCDYIELTSGTVSYSRSPEPYGLAVQYPFGTVASFVCYSGYALDGPNSATCTNSQWRGNGQSGFDVQCIQGKSDDGMIPFYFFKWRNFHPIRWITWIG